MPSIDMQRHWTLVLHKDHSYNFIDTVSKDERNVLGKALESLSANLEAINDEDYDS